MSKIIEGLLFAWKKNTEYAPRLVADQFVAGHEQVAALLENSDDTMFEKPVQLDRWKPVAGNR